LVIVLHEVPDGQSAAPAQPQLPFISHTAPLVLAVQSTQLVPEVPQAVCDEPVAHRPPIEQQPPLQVSPPAQLVPHRLLALHAVPVGQSFWLLQPQAPLTHLLPLPLMAVQSVQLAPLEPQAFGAEPATHAPIEQQPPLHAVWFASPQVISHRCVVLLHEEPARQSVATVQPQVPPDRHWVPLAAALQSVQLPPPVPQAGVRLPMTQVPPDEQQPLAQVSPPAQLVPH
jgi:hypothetical protein